EKAKNNLEIFNKRKKSPVSDTEQLQQVQKEAEAGDVKAQYNLATFYLNGQYGLLKCDEKALEWFKKAGDRGNAAAHNW
ncbi:SEL1-like repeat protein, partial [Vibrio parahaemolyticus]|nr:SEL1-like repeat protein [Vibrio parahaemolyticus]